MPRRKRWGFHPDSGGVKVPDDVKRRTEERMRNTPTHLCRLRYFGNEEGWGFAFFTYSNEKYSLSVFPNGEFLGRPEEVNNSDDFLYA